MRFIAVFGCLAAAFGSFDRADHDFYEIFFGGMWLINAAVIAIRGAP